MKICVVTCDVMLLPENLRGLTENGGGFGTGKLRISIEEDILNPANVTVRSNPFATITIRSRRTGLVFERLRQGEEANSLFL